MDAELLQFLKTAPLKEIHLKVTTKLNKLTNYCDRILGKGYYGSVAERTFGATVNLKVNKKKATIKVPIVFKLSNFEGTFRVTLVDNQMAGSDLPPEMV